MKAHIYQSLWSGGKAYYATLLGGEFDNCTGVGLSAKAAMTRLKEAVEARREEAKRKQAADDLSGETKSNT